MIDSGVPAALVKVTCVGSKLIVLCLESNDFDGSADWEKGVVGDSKLADILAAPSPVELKAVSNCGAWDPLEAAASVGS